jgi:hypothetical protein
MKPASLILGIILLLSAAAICYLAYQHRPAEGVVEAVRRFSDSPLKPASYHSLLAVAGVIGLAGLWQLIAAFRREH